VKNVFGVFGRKGSGNAVRKKMAKSMKFNDSPQTLGTRSQSAGQNH
jgi:hypothetical protein